MPGDENLTRMRAAFADIRGELAKAVVGFDTVVEQMLVALLARQHCLFEGPPGVAKSRTAAALARVLGLTFDRVRTMPDLVPEDLVGLGAAPQGAGEVPGPIFANVVLVDDYRQLPPRPAALLQQALQEGQVVLRGRRHGLREPFLLLAGCYAEDVAADPRLDTQLDRFMLQIAVAYPEYDAEFRLVESLAGPATAPLEQVVSPRELAQFAACAEQVVAPPHVTHYLLRLVRATRVHEGETPDFIYEWVDIGAGPRASHFLLQAAKIRAAWHGCDTVTADDVQAMAHPVLRHRIVTNRNARSTGVTVER